MKTYKLEELHIFDFDGTLVDSPLPETHKSRYEEITGKEWEWKGWWGRLESLSTFINEIEVNEKVFNTAINSNSVILTSRLPKFVKVVQSICNSNGFDIGVDDIHTFNGKDKGERIYDIVSNELPFSKMKTVYFYDDREKEIKSANEWKDRIESLGIKLIIVKIDEKGEF